MGVVIERSGADSALHPEPEGYFSGAAVAAPGDRYRFRVDGGESLYPDPASRFQPEGPHGPSEIIDATAFPWSDGGWNGVLMQGQILYELHVGTFTPEGTWRAAAEELPRLARLGITLIEMMPVADFAGEFGWGYDGVNLFAPCRLYGRPDDLRSFIDRAHALGIGVILDVVYNHFGPEGNYLGIYADHYVTDRHLTDWGKAINFDGVHHEPVRHFILTNGIYWIEEFHFDGFRFDATQNIYDDSADSILGAYARTVRAAAGKRSIVLIAENEPQESRLLRPRAQGGEGFDGALNDDFHHAAMVALTGRNEAYGIDYLGTPQEFISSAKYGYLYQGQAYRFQRSPRGQPALDLPPSSFVVCLENHDQVANSLYGDRIRLQTSPGRYRAMTALLLLGPWTPLLFQGQEYGSATPFFYFCDLNGGLRESIQRGRSESLRQFESIDSEDAVSRLAPPGDPKTFASSHLSEVEQDTFPELARLFEDLLRLRREDPRFREQSPGGIDGAVLDTEAFVLRFFDATGDDDRLLIVNLGRRRSGRPVPEPLLAPPFGRRWETLWSSDSPDYHGPGCAPVAGESAWTIPAEAAVVLSPSPAANTRETAQGR